ncbi:MAG: trypsin-like peptidase domain-containing protein [Fuerstiella sp.]
MEKFTPNAQICRPWLAAALVSWAGLWLSAPCPAESPVRPLTEVVSDAAQTCVRVVSAGDRSSGVLITESGHVLTVAHGIERQAARVTVITSTGTRLTAQVLFRDAAADVALLKLNKAEPPSSRGMAIASVAAAEAAAAVKDSVVLSFGYPAREPDGAGPVCRIGVVEAATEHHLRSSCTLTAGDSGGPVFDTHGQLIGIHQKIGLGRGQNLHVPMAVCRRIIERSLPDAEISLRTATSPAASEVRVTDLVPDQQMQRHLQQYTVDIVSPETGLRVASGTRLSASIVAGKLSLLPSQKSFRIQGAAGDVAEAWLIGSDRRLDLAILELAEQSLPVVPGPDVSRAEASAAELVFSETASHSGIVARVGHHERGADPVLGCTLLEVEQRLLVDRLAPNSAATEAGLQIGDEVLELAGMRLTRLDDVLVALDAAQPGDYVLFLVRRGASQLRLSGCLRHRAGRALDRAEYLDGRAGVLSHRRTGFADVIQHDGPVDADRMGGPLLDSRGRLVGVNIARRGRESVLAIPIRTVQHLADVAVRRSAGEED